MASADFPDDVRRLLRELIESHEELEALVLLAREPEPVWTPARIAAALRPAPADPVAVLDRLVARGLCARDPTGSAYRYAPPSPSLDATVQRLVALHRSDLAMVLHLLSAQAIERVRGGAMRAFADAFLLRRDKNDR